jgi:DNA-binding CsgD family transcriptional regulator
MQKAEDEFLTAIDNLYASAAGELPWNSALRSVADFFGGAGAVIFDMEVPDQRIVSWQSFGLHDGERDYIDHINAINPRMKYSIARPPGHLAHEACFITERQMDRSEFYDWVQRVGGMRYFIGSKIQQHDGLATFTSVEFTPRHGPATRAEVAGYETFTRHLRNAWTIAGRIDHVASDRDRQAFINDRLPWGVVSLGADARIVDTNAAAERILGTRDGLFVADRRLNAAKAAENRSLQASIAAMLSAPVASGPAPDAMLVSRPSGLPAYGLQMIPYIRPRTGGGQADVIVYITDPAARLLLDPAQLRGIFGLSAREAGIATLVGEGRTVQEAAERMGIATNTARNHLANVFAKTGTHSQVDLVRLLVRLHPDDTRDR